MKEFKLHTIGIVGTGAVGLRLAYFFRKKMTVRLSLLYHTKPPSRDILRAIKPDHTGKTFTILRHCSLIFLAVPDSSLKALARRLQRIHWTSKTVYLAHCSGSYSSAILEAAQKNSSAKIYPASFHPMQTFMKKPVHAGELELPDLQSTCYGIEGHHRALSVLKSLLHLLQCRYRVIPKEYKMLYHIGGITAGNFFTVLLEMVHRLYARMGWNDQQTLQFLRPLIETTLQNCEMVSPSKALTGPAARNDRALIATHLQALTKIDPLIADLYMRLSHFALTMKGRQK